MSFFILLIYLQLDDIHPDSKLILERVASVGDDDSRLTRAACSTKILSFRSSKHLENKNEDKEEKKPTDLKFAKPQILKNSNNICTVFAKEKCGAQGDVKNKLTGENKFCYLNQNTVSVKQHLCQMKRPFFTKQNTKNLFNNDNILENSTNVCYKIKRNTLRQFCWDIGDIQRNFIFESTIKSELSGDLITPHESLSLEESGILRSSKDIKSIIVEANMTPLQIENITPNTCSRIENEIRKGNPQNTGTIPSEVSEEDSSRIIEDKEDHTNSMFENELFLSLSDMSESIIDEKAVDLLLSEEEFDDDKIILQNMNEKGKLDFLTMSPSHYSVNKPLNLSDSGFDNDDFSCDQSVSSMYRSTPIDESGDEGFLNAITTLSSRLGDLIKSCRIMNSELRVVRTDLNNIEMSMNNIYLDIETI